MGPLLRPFFLKCKNSPHVKKHKEAYHDSEKITEENTVKKIHVLIWVSNIGQKGIVIGDKGAMLKKIGTSARLDLEKFFNKKIYLKIWVKVKNSWWEDPYFIEKTQV